MKKQNEHKKSYIKAFHLFLDEQKKIVTSKKWKRFILSDKRLYKKAYSTYGQCFNWRFNAIHWAFDVSKLCKEIAYSLAWMNTYESLYKSNIARGTGPSHVDFKVSYFADNCITRIDSCRDKIALMVWAYYYQFNPEERKEILVYEDIIERLIYPIKFASKLQRTNTFIKYLKLLKGDNFKRIEDYRNLKIHRREPRVEIYGVASHHDWPYVIPLRDPKKITNWRKNLVKQYPNSALRKIVERGCYQNGVLFDRRNLKDRVWDYDEVKTCTNNCFLSLLKVTDKCFHILLSRKPFRKGSSK